MTLTALIITLNEKDNIRDCLSSVSGWVDEIYLLDSGSTDGTLDIAREMGARVEVHPFDSYAAQKNRGIERSSGDWVLIIDADERVSPDLRDSILRLMAEGPKADVYRMERWNWFFGCRVRYGGSGRNIVIRLVRREKGRYTDLSIHEKLDMAGLSVGWLDGPLRHYTQATLHVFFSKTAQYAELGARDRARRGVRGSFFRMALRPCWRFFRMYLIQRGFLDGALGLALAGFNAAGVLARELRLYQLSREPHDQRLDPN